MGFDFGLFRGAGVGAIIKKIFELKSQLSYKLKFIVAKLF